MEVLEPEVFIILGLLAVCRFPAPKEIPDLQKSSQEAGSDFFFGYSRDRSNKGGRKFNFRPNEDG